MKIQKRWIYVLLFFTTLVFYVVLRKEFMEIINLIFSLKLHYLFLAMFLVALYYGCDVLRLKAFLDSKKKKVPLINLVKNIIITNFFAAVTPFATGGQPAQIYLLTKDGIKGEEATGISIHNYIVYEIIIVILGLLALIYGVFSDMFSSIHYFKFVAMGGLVIHLIVIILFTLVTVVPKFSVGIIEWFFNFLKKFKFLKDTKKSKKNAIKKVEFFQDHVSFFRKNFQLNLELSIFILLRLLFFYATPIFLIYSLGVYDFNPIGILAASSLTFFVLAFIPLPGGSGGAEFGFLAFMGAFFVDPTLAALLLLWRFVTYYLPLFVGMILLWLSNYNKKPKDRISFN